MSANFNKYIQSLDSLYNGQNDIQAGYLMADFPLVPDLRLIGGARYETTALNVHSASYLESNVTGQNINDAILEQSDILPNVGLIYAVTPKMNLRLNYSRTIARPSFRELAAYLAYDPIIDEFVEGNPNLKMTRVNNFDARWEWFPRPGELVSFSIFYKQLKNPIERGNVDQGGTVITYFNHDKAILYGVELEARKNLDFISQYLKLFSIGGNLSLLESEVELNANELSTKRAFFPNDSGKRQLYDQSPYIFNADLNYENSQLGTSASVIFNVSGPRITFAKLNTEDVYEQPAPTLDFVLSQKIGRNMSLKFSAKNLLDPDFKRTYGKDSDKIHTLYKKGITYGLSVNYDF